MNNWVILTKDDIERPSDLIRCDPRPGCRYIYTDETKAEIESALLKQGTCVDLETLFPRPDEPDIGEP